VSLVESVRENGGTVHKFSSLHVSGEQLSQMSGVAAILRFPLLGVDDKTKTRTRRRRALSPRKKNMRMMSSEIGLSPRLTDRPRSRSRSKSTRLARRRRRKRGPQMKKKRMVSPTAWNRSQCATVNNGFFEERTSHAGAVDEWPVAEKGVGGEAGDAVGGMAGGRRAPNGGTGSGTLRCQRAVGKPRRRASNTITRLVDFARTAAGRGLAGT
jgi:hypothetical protein